ncbi:MAG: hypothetical protein ACYS83_10660 [Planctomycetota bacterium]
MAISEPVRLGHILPAVVGGIMKQMTLRQDAEVVLAACRGFCFLRCSRRCDLVVKAVEI